jgi:hypothetical protein
MSERILLRQPDVVITDLEARFPGGVVALEKIQRSWVVTRRPGLALGATLAFLGAALLLRGAGLLRLVGAMLAGYGVLRARSERHTLMLQIEGVVSPQVALETRDVSLVHQALTALARAKMAGGQGEECGRLGDE